MFCKSNCCEGQELCYDVSAELRTDRHREPRGALGDLQYPPCCAEEPRLTPRWHLIALVTSYNIHRIPHHLTSVLESSSGFFLLHKTNLFLL